jgi:hypothetical protein
MVRYAKPIHGFGPGVMPFCSAAAKHFAKMKTCFLQLILLFLILLCSEVEGRINRANRGSYQKKELTYFDLLDIGSESSNKAIKRA